MTTVAYTKGVMAADSKATEEGLHVCNITKIRKVDGCLIGACGNVDLMHWFLNGFKIEVLSGKFKLTMAIPDKADFEGVIVDPKGKIFYFSDKCLVTPVKSLGYYAIGSGSSIAMGAMYAGANAKLAIQAAIKHDIHTGGPIKAIKLR